MASSGAPGPDGAGYKDLVTYQAMYNYSPSREDQEEGYIEIRDDDLLEVLSPTEEEDFQVSAGVIIKGHQHAAYEHMGQFFKTEKTIEIQPVRPTEVCGKV